MHNQIKVELQETMGNDKSIAEMAWTSSYNLESKQTKTEQDVTKIVNMLAHLKHSVPFESVVFRFWMRIPIQTDRQIMTHRIQSASGMSGRYRTMPQDWLQMPEDIRHILSGYDIETQYNELCKAANEWYKSCLVTLKAEEKKGTIVNQEYKRLREFLRGVLPQNNMTERVSIINLRSFANFYKLRSASDAQPEIQIVANEMLRLIKEKNICPVAIHALEQNQWII